MASKIINKYTWLTQKLNHVGVWVGLLSLRLLLAWEYFEAGREKLLGENWFAHIQSDFMFPFNHMPAAMTWGMATWFELIGGVLLVLGLGTRFVAFSLLILTVVAIDAVHWPDSWSTLAELAKGYSISDKGFGNFKLPVIFIAMLLPLIFQGAGKLSLDGLFTKKATSSERIPCL